MAKRSARHALPDSNSSMLTGIYSPKRRDLILQDPEKLTVGYRVRRERYLRKWSMEQMAAYLNISASYLGAIERSERSVSSKMMVKLHRKLNLSYDYLLEGIQLTGEAIAQYVRESSDYSVEHNLDVLLGVCSEEELQNCYELVHTYLTNHRHRARSEASPASGRKKSGVKSPRPSSPPRKEA
ncbi:MAG: helix-turn-helix transcriptional regulator [Lachnospiraceae bacterium]|nr:helix-turn-helix transcriptional regulator [Lachnospiraceae bacterium]